MVLIEEIELHDPQIELQCVLDVGKFDFISGIGRVHPGYKQLDDSLKRTLFYFNNINWNCEAPSFDTVCK